MEGKRERGKEEGQGESPTSTGHDALLFPFGACKKRTIGPEGKIFAWSIFFVAGLQISEEAVGTRSDLFETTFPGACVVASSLNSFSELPCDAL